ncbi:hypothetical protein CASFOL_022297 [Castilleja foliolosa]|uniref:RNase H type-1 domain-containing protein n=1 Tax=Castilleja foliolosa TaxID=1961234 RepID=A0ABD3CXZ8_9LAMI
MFDVQAFTTMVSKQALVQWNSILKTWQNPAPPQQLKPPLHDCFNVNSDSTFIDGKDTEGILIRNINDSIIFASIATSPCLDPLSAECLGILLACKTLEKLKIKQTTLETDSLNAATTSGKMLICSAL